MAEVWELCRVTPIVLRDGRSSSWEAAIALGSMRRDTPAHNVLGTFQGGETCPRRRVEDRCLVRTWVCWYIDGGSGTHIDLSKVRNWPFFPVKQMSGVEPLEPYRCWNGICGNSYIR
jgi:hypothetical protein